METLNETQTQNKNAISLWQTIGMYIGMMVGFLYPQIGSAIILILAFLILFMNHWYVPCKHAIAHLMN